MSGEERLMSDDRQALIDAMARALCAWVFDGDLIFDRLTESERDDCRNAATATLDALLAVPVPLLREIAAATKPCETCGGEGYLLYESHIPTADVAKDCPTCHGSKRVPAVDRAALLAALGMEQVATRFPNTVHPVSRMPWDWTWEEVGAQGDDGEPVWAARVSEETP